MPDPSFNPRFKTMFRPRSYRRLSAAVTLFLILVAFQNCGDIRPAADAVAVQSALESRTALDQVNMAKINADGTMKIWLSSATSSSQMGMGSIGSVGSTVLQGYTLTSYGFSAGPTWTDALRLSGKLFSFSSGAGLGTSITLHDLKASGYTVAALFDQVPDGQLFSLSANSNLAELSVSVASGVVTVTRSSSATDFVSVVATGALAAGKPVVIAVSFSPPVGSTSVMVDGQMIQTTSNTTGQPTDLMLNQRQFNLGGNATSSFRLAEIMVLSEALSGSALNTVSRKIATDFGYNGVIYDPSPTAPPVPQPPGPVTGPTGVQLYITNCSGCHGPLASSTKHGVSKSMIDNAIATQPAMSGLAGLTSDQRQRISDALQ